MVSETDPTSFYELRRRILVTVTAHAASIDEARRKREPSARELSAVGSE